MLEERLIYTVTEVAKLLHTSPNYIYTLIRSGKLEALKIGSIKILRTTLLEFLASNEGMDLTDVNNIVPLVIEKNG